MNLLFLSDDDVRSLLEPEPLLEALAEAFRRVSSGRVSAPPRIAAAVPGRGLLAAMPAHVEGIGLGAKLVAVHPANARRGIDSHHALVCAFEPDTGVPVAVMSGAELTALRTAGVSALATRLLARGDARVLAVLGAGVQGASHLRLLAPIRRFDEIRVASRDPAHAARLAASHPGARAVASFEEAVRGADVVAACTDAGEPILRLAWLAPGAHVTSVGFAGPPGELPREVIEQGRLFVEGRVAFEPHPAGAHELAGVDPARGTELGEVLLGTAPGRRSDDELTVYKSIGHAAEDVAAAALVLARARARGAGHDVEL